MYDLVCFGELLWDVFGKEKKAGGAPFNAAAIGTRLGMKTAMITAVGKDKPGDELVKQAKDDTELILQRNARPTGTVAVKLDSKKHPSFDIKTDVAYDYIKPTKQMAKALADAHFFCFGTLSQRSKVSRETLRQILHGFEGVTVYDFNHRKGIRNWEQTFRECIRYTDVLKLNDSELKMLKKAYGTHKDDEEFVLALMIENNLTHVFVTLGEEGAALYTGGELIYVDAPEADVVDTTGCGDAFTAAAVYGLSRSFDKHKLLSFAVEKAAKVSEVKGAVPGRL